MNSVLNFWCVQGSNSIVKLLLMLACLFVYFSILHSKMRYIFVLLNTIAFNVLQCVQYKQTTQIKSTPPKRKPTPTQIAIIPWRLVFSQFNQTDWWIACPLAVRDLLHNFVLISRYFLFLLIPFLSNSSIPRNCLLPSLPFFCLFKYRLDSYSITAF